MARPRVTIIRKLRRVEDILPPRVEVYMPADAHVEQRNTLRSTTIGICFAVMLLMLTAFSAARASSTISYFSDSELSAANAFNAGQLNFVVDPDGTEIFVGPDAAGSQNVATQIVSDLGSFSLKYKITTAYHDGDLDFCNALQANALSGPFAYSGALVDFDTGETSDTTSVILNVSFPLGDPNVEAGDFCAVEFIYDAWVDGEAEGDGYTDSESFMVTIHAVLPEVLPLAPLSLSASVDALTVDTLPPEEETESEERKREERTDPPVEARGEDRDESRAEDRETERDHTAEPPAEVIVETVAVPPAAETPTVTETLSVPEEEPSV